MDGYRKADIVDGVENTKDKVDAPLAMPVKVPPYRHQQEAFNFICKIFGVYTRDPETCGGGAALLQEMGTGKSFTTVAISGILYLLGLITRVLVVAPLSVLGVWKEEFESMADFSYTLTILKGSSNEKRQQIKEFSGDGLQVVVVNYDSARILVDELLQYDAELVVADEGHKLKDNSSQQSRVMHRLGDKALYRLLLTGTLITNRELDVYSEYRFVDSRVFGTSFYAFRSRYFDMVGYGNHIPRFRQWMLDDFLRRIHSIA